MARKQKQESLGLTSAMPYPEGICYVKVNEHETAGTMAVLMRSLASQLDKYERDRPIKGMRFDREKRYFLIELQPDADASRSAAGGMWLRGRCTAEDEHGNVHDVCLGTPLHQPGQAGEEMSKHEA